jgi:ParB family transcriptional regulator, chromosome partitioning protein
MVSDKLRKLVSKADAPIDNPQSSRLPLDQITDRPGGDTRPLNQSHVEALAESIAAVGLIQPIAVDNQGRLLAGGHRWKAIVQLQTTNPPAFAQWFGAGVPVHRFDFDASQDEARALAIEVSENEKRLDYSPKEVRELADRLVAAGYRATEGRPKKGEKSLIPSLAVIVGKSHRTIHRYLDGPTEGKETLPPVRVFATESPSTARSLQRLIDCDDCPDDVRSDVLKLIKKLGNSSKS